MNNNNNNQMRGILLYDINEEIPEIIAGIKTLGFNTIVTIPECVNDDLIKKAKEANIDLYIDFSVFYNPDFLKDNPDYYAITNNGEKAMEDWVHFVCPSKKDYLDKCKLHLKELLSKYNPDGLLLNFIRFFSYWEIIYFDRTPESIIDACYCPECLQNFQTDMDIKFPKSLQKASDFSGWIKEFASEKWKVWKCNIINNTVKMLIKQIKEISKDINLGAHIVPWLEQDFNNAIENVMGQDISALAEYFDFISPMAFSHMLKKEPAWINNVVSKMNDKTKIKITPCIQVDKCYLEKELSIEEFKDSLKKAFAQPSQGAIFFYWGMLKNNTAKKNILKDFFKEIDL